MDLEYTDIYGLMFILFILRVEILYRYTKINNNDKYIKIFNFECPMCIYSEKKIFLTHWLIIYYYISEFRDVMKS